MIRHISDMSEICYEPSQIFQPSGARAAPSWLGPPIRLLRSCPVFDALGVGREALRLGVGWLWCGGLHGSRCRRCRACCGFGPWQSGDAPVDYVDDSHVHVAAAGRVVDRDDAVQTIRERLPSFVVVRAAARFFHYRSGLHDRTEDTEDASWTFPACPIAARPSAMRRAHLMLPEVALCQCALPRGPRAPPLTIPPLPGEGHRAPPFGFPPCRGRLPAGSRGLGPAP